MSKQRPVNLDLTTIKFPCTAIVSILHRASGVILFLLLPVLLWLWAQSLSSPSSFASVHQALRHPLLIFLIWIMLSALAYHLVAGIRHLLMDIGCGGSLRGGRLGAYITMTLAGLLILLLGVWLW